MLQCFIRPDANIRSTWDDTYNSALIRRLLSETPLHRGIDLTPQELMDYGTGAWERSRADRSLRHIQDRRRGGGITGTDLRASGSRKKSALYSF